MTSGATSGATKGAGGRAARLRWAPRLVLLTVAALGAPASAVLPLDRLEAEEPAPRPAVRVEPDPPADADVAERAAGKQHVAAFDDFAWRVFLALAWPAQEGARGVPDRSRPLGDGASPVVWDTWKVDHELFQPLGREPTEWSSLEALSPDRLRRPPGARPVKVLGGFSPKEVDSTAIADYNQAGEGDAVGSLVARNGTYVRYHIAFNRASYEFLREQRYYLAEALPRDGQVHFPPGSIHVKAAWYVFTPEEAARPDLLARFYRRQAVLVDPGGRREERWLGLIGLHVVCLTPRHPEWIWASFEHEDLVAGPEPLLRAPSPDTPPEKINRLAPVVSIDSMPQAQPEPTLVKRLRPIHPSTQATNQAYRGDPRVRASVWAHYQLVLTQWPTSPAASREAFETQCAKSYPAAAGEPFPRERDREASIANCSMETSSVFQSGGSCMKCHLLAAKTGTGTGFVWVLQRRAYRPPAEDARYRSHLLQVAKEQAKADGR